MFEGPTLLPCNAFNPSSYNAGLSAENQKRLLEEITPILFKGRETLTQINKNLSEANDKINRAVVLKAEAENLKDLSQKLKKESESFKTQAEASQAAAEQTRQNLAIKAKTLSTKVFYTTFHGKKDLSPEEINQIFNTYLSNNSISVNFQGNYSHINSMEPFIKYLENNQTLTRCNFLHFQNHIQDVKKLADYLSLPSCKITTIAFHASISDTDKALLNAAKEAKKGLQIIYKS